MPITAQDQSTPHLRVVRNTRCLSIATQVKEERIEKCNSEEGLRLLHTKSIAKSRIEAEQSSDVCRKTEQASNYAIPKRMRK